MKKNTHTISILGLGYVGLCTSLASPYDLKPPDTNRKSRFSEGWLMRLLVTGGMGFIGANFIRHLLGSRSDIEVINADDQSYGSNPDNLKDLGDSRSYRFVRADISEPEMATAAVSDVDVVVNFAALTHVDRSIAGPQPFFKSNTQGTFALLEAARKSKSNPLFLQVGTDEVYGDVLQGFSTENGQLRPSSPYAASKAAADMFVLAYHRTYGLKTIVTRCTNNFGPYQFPEKLIPKTIIRAVRNLKIPLYGSGKQVRDWIYVADHCEALDLIINKGAPGNVYNIAGGNEVENVRLVEEILEVVGKPKSLIEFVEDRPGHDWRYALNANKLRNELGWKPRHTFRQSLQSTVNWYLANDWWWTPLADDRTLSPTPWRPEW